MVEKVFYNVFIFGTIISICISPLLIFLYKNKYKYKLKNIYKVFAIILLLLILPINNMDFSNIKEMFKKQEANSFEESFIAPIETEIILETATTVIEVNDSINIKNNNLSNFAQYVPYLWISISIIFLFYNLFSYWIYIYKSKKSCIEMKVPEIEEIINKICREKKVKNISYAFSKSITTPMVVGIFKKRILLPENILELEDYEMILMHEIVHIKNKDIECKFILLLINSIYWFNPIIYKFIDQVEEVLELKCDEIVLENQPQVYKIKYAQVLLNQIEENRKLKYRFSLSFANKRRNIMKRFSNIVDKNKKKNMIGISCITASAIIISSAIIFSFPSINFASIQEEMFNNEIANDSVLQEDIVEEENTISENTLAENAVDNSVLVEDDSKPKDEVTSTEGAEVTETNETKLISAVINEEIGVVKDTDTFSEENDNVKKVKTKVTDFSKNEVIEGYYSDEDGNTTKMITAAIPELICPLENGIITSRFGKRSTGIHTGLDINAVQGTPIRAAASGTVVYSGYKGSYGNLVIIDHGNDFQTWYAQCSKLHVEVNQEVKQGEIIAEVGMTGNSTGPHLHFEIRNNNTPVNPQEILNFNALNP